MQVNITSGQFDSWSNNQDKNVNIDLLSSVSSKDENTQSPVGRLKGCTNQWMVAGASRYILSVIQGGSRFPFKKLPESAVLRNNRSARDNPSFVGSENQSLLDKRCIVDLFVCLFCCFTSQVNSYGHCGTVSSPNHTFSWASLNKQLTSTSCTYFRL